MKDKEIIDKIIDTITDSDGDLTIPHYDHFSADYIKSWTFYKDELLLCNEEQYEDSEIIYLRDIIFSHDFAKAFWKDRERLYYNDPGWEHNLQEMVLEENPLKYLEKFLKE